MIIVLRLNFIVQIFLRLSLVKETSCQVNRNLENLHYDFNDKARGFNYDMLWFKPTKMSAYAKFLLCVDVYQKQINTTLTGGHYTIETLDQRLPQFQQITLKIGNLLDPSYPTVNKHVMHCPLNLVKFENIFNDYGEEFYITESSNEYCVYTLLPAHLQTEAKPILYLTAEICGLFLNIRYDKLELEKEFEDHLMMEGIELLSWPRIDQISNKEKFLLCLSVHEKLSRQSFYKVPFRSHEPGCELPTCTTVSNYFIITTYKGEHPRGFIDTLYCPMHKILFLNKDKSMPTSPKTIKPYYLAQSVNPNCVYKMGIKGMMIQPQMHNSLSHEVFIQGEICGIFGTVNYDTAQIESKLLLNWNTIPREIIESGGELINMGSTYQAQLCGNVYRKVNGIGYLYDNETFCIPKTRELVLVIGGQHLKVIALHCQMEKFNPLSIILLASSASLGCVYKLDHNRSIARIQFEICDVLPSKHLLHMAKPKAVEPII